MVQQRTKAGVDLLLLTKHTQQKLTMLTDSEIIKTDWYNLSLKQLEKEYNQIVDFNERALKSNFYGIKPNHDASANIFRAIELKTYNPQLTMF